MNAVAVQSLPLPAEDNPDWDSGTAELGHVLKPGQLDLSHKVILYLEDIKQSASTAFGRSTSCRWRSMPASCAASSDRTAPARRR